MVFEQKKTFFVFFFRLVASFTVEIDSMKILSTIVHDTMKSANMSNTINPHECFFIQCNVTSEL